MMARRTGDLVPLSALLAYGWREAFVPLVVVAHNQHGAVLATAGLAVGASRIGTWLWARYSGETAARPAQSAALVAGLVLVLIGLAPEEGPLSLVLWGAFGLAWPAVQQTLLVASPALPAALVVLLAGMVLAGPMALGPGAWLMAAGYLAWSWRLGHSSPGPAGLSGSRPARATGLSPWAAALPAIAMSIWLWMIPARLLNAGVPVAWCGVALALGWAPYVLAMLATRSRQPRQGSGLVELAAAGLLVPAVLGLGLAETSWQVVAFMAACSLLAGLVRVALDPASNLYWPPSEGQALGEFVGPLLGVLLLVIAGPTAVFGGGAVAAVASVGLLAARRAASE